MTTCITCAHWSLKSSTLAKNGMAPCSLGASYTALRPDDSCERHTPLGPALFAKRAAWLGRKTKE